MRFLHPWDFPGKSTGVGWRWQLKTGGGRDNFGSPQQWDLSLLRSLPDHAEPFIGLWFLWDDVTCPVWVWGTPWPGRQGHHRSVSTEVLHISVRLFSLENRTVGHPCFLYQVCETRPGTQGGPGIWILGKKTGDWIDPVCRGESYTRGSHGLSWELMAPEEDA